MTTKKERAIDSVHKNYNCDGKYPCERIGDCEMCGGCNTPYDCCECAAGDYMEGYLSGATEQEALTKQEMIARTCEWMRNHNAGEEVIGQYVKDMEE